MPGECFFVDKTLSLYHYDCQGNHMTNQEIASRLVRGDAPKLSTQVIAEYLERKPVTIRSWVTREYIQLIDTERGSSGRGNSSLFSPLDIVQLMLCAKMARFSIIPEFLAKFSEEVTANVLDILHLFADPEEFEKEKRGIIIEHYERRIKDLTKRGYPKENIKVLEELKEEALSKDAVMRYYSIAYSPLMREFWGVPTGSGLPTGSGGKFFDPVILVFDCLDVAEKLIALYREKATF